MKSLFSRLRGGAHGPDGVAIRVRPYNRPDATTRDVRRLPPAALSWGVAIASHQSP